MSKRKDRSKEKGREKARRLITLERDLTQAAQTWDLNSKWQRTLVVWFLGAFICLIYMKTMYPSIGGGDAGELMGVACTWGVAHPPGYPTFSFLGGLFAHLPFGNPGWRVSMVSVLCGVTSAMLLGATVNRATRNLWGGVVAGGLFAFSPLVWSYATLAEVFALNHVFLTLMLYVYVVHVQSPAWRTFRLFFLIFGLALTNHHTSLFMGLPLSLLILLQPLEANSGWPILRAKSWLTGIGMGLLGLLPYLYLPIASYRNPIIAWGDITSVEGFFRHLLRREYGTFRLANLSFGGQESTLLVSLREYFSHITSTTYYVGMFGALAGLGYYLIWNKRTREDLRRILFATLLVFWFYLIVFHALANLPLHIALFRDVHMRFWQMADLFVFAWIGVAFSAGFEVLETKVRSLDGASTGVERTKESVSENGGVGSPLDYRSLLKFATPALACILVATQVLLHYRTQDHSDNWTIHHYGRGLLENIPNDSILMSKGDLQTNSTRYQQQCENFRRDVKIVDRPLLQYRWQKRILTKYYPDVVFPGTHYSPEPGGFSLYQFFAANQPKRRIFVSDFDGSDDSASWKDKYFLRTAGTHAEVMPVGAPFDPKQYLKETTEGLAKTRHWMDRPELQRFKHGAWEVLGWQDRVEAPRRIGLQLVDYAKLYPKDVELARAGAQMIEESLGLRPQFPTLGGVPPQTWKSLGLALEQVARNTSDANEKNVALQKMLQVYGIYLKVPMPGDADLPRIQTLVQSGGADLVRKTASSPARGG